ncbi:MAG TPA: hypothetical protein VMY35_10475 [Phycisphaerae bacterium]|nr:hypothetical protein [Phycisphaerae bacterium]
MPLPKRRKGEKKAAFVDRCMADAKMVKEYPDAEQRRAICEGQSAAAASEGPAIGLAGSRWDGGAEAPATLELSGPVDFDLEAAAGADGTPRLPRFKMIAYTGGPMRISLWRYPVVVDLAGLAIPNQNAPIRESHQSRIGHAQSIAVVDGNLTASGTISCTGPAAKEVVDDAKNGFPWKASIGASVDQFEFVKENQKATVNGRDFDGPVNIVRKSTLLEISFVDVPADPGTSVKVAAKAAASNMGDTQMDWEKWLTKYGIDAAGLDDDQTATLRAAYDAGEEPPAEFLPTAPKKRRRAPANSGSGDVDAIIAAAKAERERVRQITALVEEAASTPGADIEALEDIAAKATTESWPVKDLELAILRVTRPKAPAIHARTQQVGQPLLEAAALMAAGFGGDGLVRSLGQETVEAASRRYGQTIGLQELILEAAAANGYTGRARITPGNWREVLSWAAPPPVQAAGFSTVDLTGILGAVAYKALAAVAGEPQWLAPLITGKASHANFHSHTVYSLAMTGELLPVGPTGELKHMKFSEESYTRQVSTRGAILRLSRTDVINDDLGVFTRNASGLARKSYTTREKALFTAVCVTGAGTTHFTAAHGNYLTGAGTAFSAAAMATAIVAFRGLKGPDGDPIMVEPAVLLLPPTLEDEGRRLLATGSNVVMYGVGAAKSIGSSANVYAGRFGGAPLISPWLENAALTGHSAAYWYLLADPNQYPCFEIAYLNGAETPIVEYFGLESQADVLGMTWRVYWDFGVGAAEWRAGVKSAGA